MVEAIIGAIYLDGKEKGMIHATNFIYSLINLQTLNDAWESFKKENSLFRGGQAPYSLECPFQFAPFQSGTLDELPPTPGQKFKSLLQDEILQPSSMAKPTYTLDFADTPQGPRFIARLSGIFVQNIEGYGSTQTLAEEDAARRAINRLKGCEFYSSPDDKPRAYSTFIEEYIRTIREGKIERLEPEVIPASFIAQFTLEGCDPFIGEGNDKNSAEEQAAEKAYKHLMTMPAHKDKHTIVDPSSNFRSRLKSLNLGIQPSFTKKDTLFAATVTIGPFPLWGIVTGKGQSISTKKDAIENAFKDAFNRMVTKKREDQEKAAQFLLERKERLRRVREKTKEKEKLKKTNSASTSLSLIKS